MVKDLISNMLISIKNAQLAGRDMVIVPQSRLSESVLQVLQQSGYINNFKTVKVDNFNHLKVSLSDKKIIHIKRISRPGLRVYKKSKLIPRLLHGRGLVVISTNQGVMPGWKASTKGLGGEIICEVY